MTIGSRHRHNRAALLVAIGVSIVLHVPILAALSFLKPDDSKLEPTQFNARNELSVTVVDEEESEEAQDPEQQYVSFEPPEVEETPKEARLLDQHASEAEKETVRKALPGAPAQPSTPRPPVPREEPTPEEPAQESAPSEVDAPSESAKQATRESSEEEARAVSEAQPAPPEKPEPQALFPSMAAENFNPQGQGGSVDYLRDVDEGDKTLLNRKRSRYWAFFDRVKRQVSKQWSPVSEYRKRDPYGNVYGVKDRYSTVAVTLNGDGTVRQVYLARASGLEFFDDEAVRSIRSAAPFHNPPEGLKDEDGLIHFTFGFYFEISSGSFRFIRVFN